MLLTALSIGPAEPGGASDRDRWSLLDDVVQILALATDSRATAVADESTSLFWTCLCQLRPGRRHAFLSIGQATTTVLRWRRMRLSRSNCLAGRVGRVGPGGPASCRAVQELIRQMCQANPTWVSPLRIDGQLVKLGITIAEAAVGHYMVRRRPPPSQTWRSRW